jgi:hypothetical protein
MGEKERPETPPHPDGDYLPTNPTGFLAVPRISMQPAKAPIARSASAYFIHQKMTSPATTH